MVDNDHVIVDADVDNWFGDVPCLGEWDVAKIVQYLRDVDDGELAEDVQNQSRSTEVFARPGRMTSLFNRFVRTTSVCGFLPASAAGGMSPVSLVPGDPDLVGRRLRVSLESLHVARYPGRGAHKLLFDFAMQPEAAGRSANVYHYNAKFEARDSETVPVRGFPIYLDVPVSEHGLTFGFQTINVSSSIDESLFDFLGSSEFKRGLSLLSEATPVLGQLSQMGAGMAKWVLRQNRNVKVQEFRQGLGVHGGRLRGGLAAGYYAVAQIPIEFVNEWNWPDWSLSPNTMTLTRPDADAMPLDFNHMVFGVHPMPGDRRRR